MALAVQGFATHTHACAFETAWQYPADAFVLTPMERSAPRRALHQRSIEEHVAELRVLLPAWQEQRHAHGTDVLHVVDMSLANMLNAKLNLPLTNVIW